QPALAGGDVRLPRPARPRPRPAPAAGRRRVPAAPLQPDHPRAAGPRGRRRDPRGAAGGPGGRHPRGAAVGAPGSAAGAPRGGAARPGADARRGRWYPSPAGSGSSAAPTRAQPPERPMNLAPILDLLRARTGLDPASLGPHAVAAAVAGRLAELGLEAGAYAGRLAADPAEFGELVDAVVVPETWFFRGGELFPRLAGLARSESARRPRATFRARRRPCRTREA